MLALAGDYVGPEVVGAGLEVLVHAAKTNGLAVAVEEGLIGGASWDVHGTFCTDETLEKARHADAVLVGAVGGPKWDHIKIDGPITETDGLTRLRVELDIYNALRPVRSWKPLLGRTPYRPEVVDGADIMVIRENCGGIYYGEPRGQETLADGQQRAFEISEYTTSEVERIARAAFEEARRRRNQVTSIDKSNVMESGKLWRETVSRIGADEYPDVGLQHLLADYALYALVDRPRDFDVVLADNLFGDLVSDMVGTLAGSLGMLPSATLPRDARPGEKIKPGVFEPSHGTAPDIAGQGIANPIGTILSVAMMFEYAFARQHIARSIESAVEQTLEEGILTPDLGGAARTAEVTARILHHLV
ncbi:MAG: 3-isopropylmalate dehydrogenase [Alphaproteobacteria bacterium]|nr:3-isopropylmalate dehydrogenase [Alphaproteobacteria bacterium]